MKGNQEVIEQLQELLAHELSAFEQYFIHARMYADWGLEELEQRCMHEAEEEKEHAQALIDRILFLEATPRMEQRAALNIGTDVLQMLNNDLQYEYAVADGLRVAIGVCEQQNDYQTRQILLKLLADTEEDHMYWLEQQVGLVEKVGIENYIQSKLSA